MRLVSRTLKLAKVIVGAKAVSKLPATKAVSKLPATK